MIRRGENWKAFIVENQTHYNQTNESRFNLVELTPEERGWTELFQVYPPITSSGGSGTSPINGRSYSWTYGFLPVGYFGVKNQSRVFTSSGTWTCPEAVEEIYVRCIGKGGNGNNADFPKGGAGGGFIMAKIKVIPGTNYSVAVSSTASFGGVISATAGGDAGGSGGSFTYDNSIEVLFTGKGGSSINGAGGAGGSELGTGAQGSFGGAGLKGDGNNGGGGMIGSSTILSSGGAGFIHSLDNRIDYGGGMFSGNLGLKTSTPPYYSLLSVSITENLRNFGIPGNYGGGSGISSSGTMFSGGGGTTTNATINGGFGGGGGSVDGDYNGALYGGNGGYGGGGGFAKNVRAKATGIGGDGGSGGGGGRANAPVGRGGNGGYGGGGGGGTTASGSGGGALVVIEW